MRDLRGGDCRIERRYDIRHTAAMSRAPMKKLTVLAPEDLVREALKASGQGLTPTVQMGLRLVAAKQAYEVIRRYRGRYRFSIPLEHLRRD